jgi:hypothetical protein
MVHVCGDLRTQTVPAQVGAELRKHLGYLADRHVVNRRLDSVTLIKRSTFLSRNSSSEVEPTRGLEPRTFRLQGAKSVLTMASTSDFIVYGDRSGGHSGRVGHKFASQVVSRR